MRGIILIALGYDLYGSYAYNLALSLKASGERIRVCLLYEPQAISKLSESELSLFDDFVLIPEHEYANKQYHRAKLLAYKYSPYDFSIYMDVDTIWIPDKKIADIILPDQEFSIGINGHYDVQGQREVHKKEYTYWGSASDTAKYFDIKKTIPQTVSGFFAFSKCEKAKSIFDIALMVYDDENAPAVRWGGGKADEYCFNVAMGLLDYTQQPFEVFYFDKINGEMELPDIYHNFFGIAMGGHKVPNNLIILYNKLLNLYSERMQKHNRFYFVDKASKIPDRKIF